MARKPKVMVDIMLDREMPTEDFVNFVLTSIRRCDSSDRIAITDALVTALIDEGDLTVDKKLIAHLTSPLTLEETVDVAKAVAKDAGGKFVQEKTDK